MDTTERQALLHLLAGAIELEPQALSFFFQRELSSYFVGNQIADDDDRREQQLLSIRRQAERMGVSVKAVYFDPEDPTAIVIEKRIPIRPPV